MNLWMKRAIGAAALSGGLLALSAGAASAQDVSADVSANLGRSTSAEVRVCADARDLSGLLGGLAGLGANLVAFIVSFAMFAMFFFITLFVYLIATAATALIDSGAKASVKS